MGSLGLGQMLSWDQALVQGLKEYLRKHSKLISNLANIHFHACCSLTMTTVDNDAHMLNSYHC